MTNILRMVAGAIAPLTLLGAVLAYLQPAIFLVFEGRVPWLFAATMFALGLVLEPRDLGDTLREPKAIVQGVLAQYTIMPLLGLAAAWFGGFDAALALGFVIVGCAPGAMASNVIVYLAGGALAFSISLTTVATMLSPLMTPLLVKTLGGAFLPVAVLPMVATIAKTVLLPLFAGMLLKRLFSKGLAQAEAVAPAVATLAIVIICSYAVAANHERLASIGPSVFLFVVLLNALGYLFGWTAAKRFGFDRRRQVTLAIEIGMQNAGLGVVLASEHFTPETALPGALFAVWCVLTSAGAASYFRQRQRSEAAVTP